MPEVSPSHEGMTSPESQQERNSSNIEQMYRGRRQELKELYRGVDLWHGTGRFTDRGNIDVLKGIISAGALVPSRDVWDVSQGEIQSISTTWMRPYSGAYSDMHQRPDEKLLYTDERTKNY